MKLNYELALDRIFNLRWFLECSFIIGSGYIHRSPGSYTSTYSSTKRTDTPGSKKRQREKQTASPLPKEGPVACTLMAQMLDSYISFGQESPKIEAHSMAKFSALWTGLQCWFRGAGACSGCRAKFPRWSHNLRPFTKPANHQVTHLCSKFVREIRTWLWVRIKTHFKLHVHRWIHWRLGSTSASSIAYPIRGNIEWCTWCTTPVCLCWLFVVCFVSQVSSGYR